MAEVSKKYERDDNAASTFPVYINFCLEKWVKPDIVKR